MTSRDKVKNMIKEHEGCRYSVYKDSVGVLTCGYGHALHEGSEVPEEVADIFFKYDFMRAEEDATTIEIGNGLNLNAVRHAVLTDMAFNLGYGGLIKFKKFIKAMKLQQYRLASVEMLDSRWAIQVGQRARYLSELMEKGEWI